MQTHLSAREIADLKVPGLPASVRRIQLKAQAEGWASRRRGKVGGELEFALASLPTAAQEHIRAVLAAASEQCNMHNDAVSSWIQDEAKTETAAPTAASEVAAAKWEQAAREQRTREEGLKAAVSLNAKEQRRVSAKLHILQAFELFHRTHLPPIGLTSATFLFERAYNAGTVPVDPLAREVHPVISRASLCRWRTALRAEGLPGLRGKYGARKGSGTIDSQPKLRDFILGRITHAPHLRMASLLEDITARFRNDVTISIPSPRALERWVTAWKRENEQQHTYNTDPDAWKSRFMSAVGSSSEKVTAPNELWEIDSSPADVMLVDGRHNLVAVIDVYTRRLKVLVSKTSKAETVGLTLRRALIDWGVPTALKTDNGKDYTSMHVHMFLRALDVRQDLCLPFTPEGKPHVERAFGTLTRDLSERLEGYIGHNVADRKAIENRLSFAQRLEKSGDVVPVKLSAAELQAIIDEWVENKYHQAPHAGLDGLTPLQVLAAWSGPPVRRISDERALDMLLAPTDGDGLRTVQKKGIRVGGAWYLAPNHELVGYERQRVQVRHDPRDMGKVAVYGGPDMGFICTAVCAELLGVDRAEYAATNRAMQKKLMREGLAHGKRLVKELRTGDIIGELRGHWAKRDGRLLAFPGQEVEHDTPELRAALAAAHDRDAAPAAVQPHDEETLAAGAYITDFVAERERLLDTEEPIHRFMRLAERLKGGGQVDEDEARFMRHFETTREYRGWLMVQEAAADQTETQA